ncbi:hypothetical protein MRX96_024491 [Rhipicephalus microplus]
MLIPLTQAIAFIPPASSSVTRSVREHEERQSRRTLGAQAETQPELQQQSPEVVADYSVKEVRRWLDMPSQLYELISREDVNEVVDQMVLAIRETYPKTRYISKFRLGGILYYGAAVLPTELADLAIGLGMRTLPFVSRVMRTHAGKR